ETKAAADAAIRRLISEAETEARVLLEHHRPVLDTFAATLAEVETLEGAPLQRHLDDLRARMQPVGRARVRAQGVSQGGSQRRRTTANR
ncbi:MAG TPA: hypothetical protein VFH54_18980, partial [Mycobacteriales bacterium]|nr:hypothetical protein [Mycobacteriales bacterium]